MVKAEESSICPIDVFRLSPQLALQWAILGLALLFISLVAVNSAYYAIHHQPWLTTTTFEIDLPRDYSRLAGGLVLPIATLALHEGIHGLAFRAFGGSPNYGIKVKYLVPYLYMTAPGQRFTRNAFWVILLAPLVSINFGALLLLLSFPQFTGLGWVVALNTSGAIGDLWMAIALCRYPASVIIEDRRDGHVVYGSREVARRLWQRRHHPSAWPHNSRQIITLTLFAFVLLNVTPLLLLIPFDMLQVPPFQLALGNRTLFQWERGREGFGIVFNPLAVGLLSLIVAMSIAGVGRILRR